VKRVYLDNAATSFPKAPGLGQVISSYIEEDCVNINRTDSRIAMKSFDFLFSLRENLCTLFNYPHPECVIFRSGLTEAVNWMIKGLLKQGDHVVVTSLEHNAVMRPLVQRKIAFSRIPCNSSGYCSAEDAEKLIRPETRAMIINAASNVFGTVQDLKALSLVARKHNLLFIVDSAQACPHVKIDMQELDAAAVCFAGHKGLLGPQGTGGFIVRKDVAPLLDPLVAGGTGSRSDSEEIPSMLPDRFSPGTENLPGLRGLAHSVQYVLDNIENLEKKTVENTKYLYGRLSRLDGIRIVGPGADMNRTSAISVVSDRTDIAFLSAFLAENGVETRVGMHCAPAAHRAMGTFPGGTLRLSAGPFTTREEIDFAVTLLAESLATNRV